MILNEEIARSFEQREAGVFIPDQRMDINVNAVLAVFSTMNVKGGEGREITMATIRNILTDAKINLTPDEIGELAAELVGRGLVSPVLQVIDGESYHILEQGEDYTSLSAILTGKEPCVGPNSGEILHKSQVFVSYKIEPGTDPEGHKEIIAKIWNLYNPTRVKVLCAIIALVWSLSFLLRHVDINLH